MAGETYDLSLEGRDIVTPEAALSLKDVITEYGLPDGYLSECAFAEPSCYFLTLFWFGKGLSARTIFLPPTEKITPDTAILSLEHFAPTANIHTYADDMKVHYTDPSASYHDWVDVDSIIYP